MATEFFVVWAAITKEDIITVASLVISFFNYIQVELFFDFWRYLDLRVVLNPLQLEFVWIVCDTLLECVDVFLLVGGEHGLSLLSFEQFLFADGPLVRSVLLPDDNVLQS